MQLGHRLEPVPRHVVSSRACWPAHRFGVLLGSRGERRWRPARVRGPAVGSLKKLARGNWHASIRGRAVTGARTDGDVGGCLGTGGARKWRLEGVKRGEIVRENVGIRVLGCGRMTVFVRAREVDRRMQQQRRRGTEKRRVGRMGRMGHRAGMENERKTQARGHVGRDGPEVPAPLRGARSKRAPCPGVPLRGDPRLLNSSPSG